MAGETKDKVGMLGREVVLFADVVTEVIEFLAAGLVVVNKFPVAFADGTVEVDARATVAPHMGIVPDEGAACGLAVAP